MTGFSRGEAILFSGSSVALGVVKLFFIRASFGDDIFRSYALWLPAATAVTELLYLAIDAHRTKGLHPPMRWTLALASVAVILFGLVWGLGGGPAGQLAAYALVDSLLFVDIAYRRRGINWALQLLRWLALAPIREATLGWLVVISALSLALMAPASLMSSAPTGAESLRVLRRALVITLLARSRTWLVTYVTQTILAGTQYFVFYLAVKIVGNIAGTCYLVLRSSFDFRVPEMRDALAHIIGRWTVVVGSLATISVLVALKLGCWLYVFEWPLENVAAQLTLFGTEGGLSRLLLANVIGIFGATLCLLPFVSVSGVWCLLAATALTATYVVTLDRPEAVTIWRYMPGTTDVLEP